MRATSINDPIPIEFVQRLSQVLEHFFKGLYSQAKAGAQELTKDLGQPRSASDWEALIATGLSAFMNTWDAGAAVQQTDALLDTLDEARGPWARLRLFYTLLLRAWTGDADNRNLRALYAATSAARAAGILTRESFWKEAPIVEFLREVESSARYIPPQWAPFWFRARIRMALMLPEPAIEDFNSVASRLSRIALKHLKDEMTAKAGRDVKFEQTEPTDAVAHLVTYGREKSPLVARFLHDAGLALFELGDWGGELKNNLYEPRPGYPGAEQLIAGAAEIDPSNPYILATQGFIYNYSFREGKALEVLEEAYTLLEGERHGRSIDDWYASGRIYFQMAVLALKRKNLSGTIPDPQRVKDFEAAISRLKPRNGLAAILAEDNGAEILAKLSLDHFTRISERFGSLPAAILPVLDPYSAKGRRDQRAARRLLWELLYGMGTDLIGNLGRLDNQLREEFARDLEEASS